VTDINGCKNADTIEVNVHLLPEIYFSFSGDTIVCLSSASFALPQAFPPGGLYSGDGISENVFNPGIAGLGDHVITYTYTDSLGCSNDSSFTITVTICSGIETTSSSVYVYPNPSNGIMVIERSDPTTEVISVSDVSGKILFSKNLQATLKTEIDLGCLPSGIYFLREEKNKFLQKIILSR
jgi:hypothetical protein